MRLGVVGATGLVGDTFLNILRKETQFPLKNLKLFASDSSAGKTIQVRDNTYTVEVLKPGCFKDLDLVFFSSGDDISLDWAPKAVAEGAFAVDNSAAFRMNERYPLVVPEINGDLLPDKSKPTIIANPNCSTIQLVMALCPLQKFGFTDITVSSYQAVSGAGKPAQEELKKQASQLIQGETLSKPENFPHNIAFNCIPQIGSFNDAGFCSEEVKIMKETKKILRMPQLKVSAFTVRIPTLNSHCETVWVQFEKKVEKNQIVSALREMPGLQYIEQKNPSDYPINQTATQQYPVYVGRVHQDLDDDKKWLFWIVGDNLLKGAALNGFQIAQRIFDL